MEELVKQAFLQIDIIGPHVHQGHYDLVGPDGEIILPQVWETLVQPDWSITMHMWPMPDAAPAEPSVEANPPPQYEDRPPSAAPVAPPPPQSRRRAKQRGRVERTTIDKDWTGFVGNASSRREKRPDRKDRDVSKRPPSGFFTWAASKRSEPPFSTSESSAWSSSPRSCSASSSAAHGIASSPGSKAHDIVTSTSPTLNDARVSLSSESKEIPTEAIVEMEALTRPTSSEPLRSIDSGEDDSCAEVSNSPHEDLPPLFHDFTMDNGSLQAHISDYTSDEDALI